MHASCTCRLVQWAKSRKCNSPYTIYYVLQSPEAIIGCSISAYVIVGYTIAAKRLIIFNVRYDMWKWKKVRTWYASSQIAYTFSVVFLPTPQVRRSRIDNYYPSPWTTPTVQPTWTTTSLHNTYGNTSPEPGGGGHLVISIMGLDIAWHTLPACWLM